MLSTLPIMDYDELFAITPNAISITEVLTSTASTKEYINELFSDGSQEILFYASCPCGATSGNFNIGTICRTCKHEVQANSESLDYRVWLEIPDELPPVLNPAIYRILHKFLKYNKSDSYLDAILDPAVPLPANVEKTLGKGMKYFYENFDDIMNFFFKKGHLLFSNASKKKPKADLIRKMLRKYSDRIFVRHVPALNQLLHMITKSGTMTYSDSGSEFIFKAISQLSELCRELRYNKSTEYTDRRLYDIYMTYHEYLNDIIKVKLTPKLGLIRRHLFGARMHCTFRAVIVPITKMHTCDELHLPWKIGVSNFKLEIYNKLFQRGYTFQEAFRIHALALVKHVPLIAEILDELMAECPYKGLPVFLDRNPSMRHGSNQLYYVTEIKQDPNDHAIAVPATSIFGSNADFDGDELNGLGIKEMAKIRIYKSMHPLATMLGNPEHNLSDIVRITDQAALALHVWLKEESSTP